MLSYKFSSSLIVVGDVACVKEHAMNEYIRTSFFINKLLNSF